MDITRKTALRLLFAVPLAVISSGAAPYDPNNRRIVFTPNEGVALDKISDYLNSIRTLKGSFIQFGPQGQLDRGTIYLSRPGKVRFEFLPPNPVLIVSDGKTIAVANTRLGTVDKYSLSDTPFELLLADKVDLRRNVSVMSVVFEPGLITVRARTSRYRHTPNVSFVFAEPSIEFRQWTITDAQGLNTTVALSELQPGAALSDELFALPKKRRPGPASAPTPPPPDMSPAAGN
jgi:outer membrane lipoprotein-sorting protein